jgi:RecA-family ATPase
MNVAALSTTPFSAAQDALVFAARYVATVPPSERLYGLEDAARSLGEHVARGWLNPATAADRIFELADLHRLSGEPGSDEYEKVREIALLASQPATPDEPPVPAEYGRSPAAEPAPRPQAPAAAPEILPFETFDASQWEGVPVEPRRWIAPNRIPVGEPGIMSGDGGTGKTKLALQFAVAITACLRDWIGGVVDAEGPVVVMSAEEKLKEMHRRTLDVIEHRGLSFSDLRGGLHFICDHDNPVLGALDRNGVVQPTMSLLRLEKTVAAIRPALVIIENAADVYGGSEIDRSNVTRFMRGLLGRLTVPCESTVMLIQHPSVAGLNDGTGRSGSTGWNNSGRWRNNFTRVKDEDGLRQFEAVKNNYGPDGEKVRLRWDRGVFVPEGSAPPMQLAAAFANVNALFLKLLEERNAQGRWVTPNKAAGYAPKELAAMSGTGGVTPAALASAMERLLAAQQVTVETFGPPSKQRQRLVVTPSNRLRTAD